MLFQYFPTDAIANANASQEAVSVVLNGFFLFVFQCTAPMSHQTVSQTPPQQSPQPYPQSASQQRQDMTSSSEAVGPPGEALPDPLPFHGNTLRSCSPKPDASELYLKSKAIVDSKRKSDQELTSSRSKDRWTLLIPNEKITRLQQ